MVGFLNELTTWILYFFAYSILGWIFESAYCSIKAKPPHFINRGFLFGPLCPIYGSGLVAVAFFVQPFKNLNPAGEFLLVAGICTVIEYISSYVMEKLYHVRWWSYKNTWWNFTINGRVSFWTTVAFGLGGLFVLTYIHPSLVAFVGSFSFALKMALSVSLITIFIIDNYLSNAAAASVKHALKGGRVDLTDEIKRYSVNYYRKQTRKTRRIMKAILKRMKKAQKMAIKRFKKTQKRLAHAAKKAQSRTIARQKRTEAKTILRKQIIENKREYRAKLREIHQEIAETNIKTIPKKTEKLHKNSKIDMKK